MWQKMTLCTNQKENDTTVHRIKLAFFYIAATIFCFDPTNFFNELLYKPRKQLIFNGGNISNVHKGQLPL